MVSFGVLFWGSHYLQTERALFLLIQSGFFLLFFLWLLWLGIPKLYWNAVVRVGMLQDLYPMLSMVPQGLHTLQEVRSLTICTVSRKVKANLEACCALSLKPKQQLFNFLNSYIWPKLCQQLGRTCSCWHHDLLIPQLSEPIETNFYFFVNCSILLEWYKKIMTHQLYFYAYISNRNGKVCPHKILYVKFHSIINKKNRITHMSTTWVKHEHIMWNERNMSLNFSYVLYGFILWNV